MWYYCVLEESDRFFQTSPCTIMIQNESVKRFFRTRRSRVLKNLFGRVLNHYGTGTSLKKSVGLLEHTVIPHSFALLISRYILRLGQQRGRCCFCAACPICKMYLEIRSADERALNGPVVHSLVESIVPRRDP